MKNISLHWLQGIFETVPKLSVPLVPSLGVIYIFASRLSAANRDGRRLTCRGAAASVNVDITHILIIEPYGHPKKREDCPELMFVVSVR